MEWLLGCSGICDGVAFGMECFFGMELAFGIEWLLGFNGFLNGVAFGM